MKKELNYLALKRWGKVGRQEFHSTSYKQEIDPWTTSELTGNVCAELNGVCRYGKNSSGLRCRNSESFAVNGIGG
jgi:hypothetical protein